MQKVNFFMFSQYISALQKENVVTMTTEEDCSQLVQEYSVDQTVVAVLIFTKKTSQFTCFIEEERNE